MVINYIKKEETNFNCLMYKLQVKVKKNNFITALKKEN